MFFYYVDGVSHKAEKLFKRLKNKVEKNNRKCWVF